MKISHTQTSPVRLIMLVVVAMLAIEDGRAQTVISRARIGGYAEDITHVSSGTLKDQVVMTNGYELYATSLEKKGTLTRVCKIDASEIDQFVNGFTYVASEKLFVMNNDPHPDKLFVFDQACNFKESRRIQYLNSNYRPRHIEGMAYIPADAPTFPDHLIMVAWDDLNVTAMRLVIMRRDGVQVAEISRQDWPSQFFEGGVGDVTFLAPNSLLVSLYHQDSLWTMDFNGNILAGPLSSVAGMGEGVTQTGDGRVVATSYPQQLLLFDKNLIRQPQNDRQDVIGLNLNVPGGIAWDSDTNRLLVAHDTQLTTGLAGVSAIATTLDNTTPVVDLNPFAFTRQTVYLPQEDLIGVLRFAPANNRAILLFNTDGSLNSQISLTPASLGQNFGPPLSLAYLPGTDEFVVGFQGVPGPGQAQERLRLRVISRTGALVRTIDLTATGVAGVNGLEYFEDPQGGGGRLLLLGAFGRMIVTDLNGNSRDANSFVLGEFNSRVKLGLITRNDIAAITSGPLAGSFAMVDGSGGEVVIFRMN